MDNNFKVGALLHDGLHIHTSKTYNDSHRIEVEHYIKTQTDFEMNIVVKPMIVHDDTIVRMNTGYIEPNVLHTCDPMVIFDPSVVNAKLIRKVKRCGYRIGVWTCDAKYALPLAEWRAYIRSTRV